MKESTRKKAVYVVSALALTWALANMDNSENITPEIPEAARPEIASKVLPSANKLVINVVEKQKLAWGTDPFRHKKAPNVKPTSRATKPVWKLGGILYNSTSPVAYINKKAIRVGDIVNNARVVAIDKKSVTLELEGNRFTIKVTRG